MPVDPSEPTNDVEPPRKVFSIGRLFVVLFGACVVGYLGWQFFLAIFGAEAVTARTGRLLAETTFKKFEIRDATLPEAIEVYRRALGGAGISEKRIRVRVTDPDQTGRKVSFTLTNLPAIIAGRYVAHSFDLGLSIAGKELRIEPKRTELIRRSLPFGLNRLPKNLVTLNPDGSYDLRELLKTSGVKFADGAWANFYPGSSKLEVFLPEEEILLIETLSPVYLVKRMSWRDRAMSWIRSWF